MSDAREALVALLHNEGDGGIWEHFDRKNSEAVADAILSKFAVTERGPVARGLAQSAAGDGPCHMTFPHPPHRWDREARTHLRWECPGVQHDKEADDDR